MSLGSSKLRKALESQLQASCRFMLLVLVDVLVGTSPQLVSENACVKSQSRTHAPCVFLVVFTWLLAGYCHMVAGLVGEGLTRIFVSSGLEPWGIWLRLQCREYVEALGW